MDLWEVWSWWASCKRQTPESSSSSSAQKNRSSTSLSNQNSMTSSRNSSIVATNTANTSRTSSVSSESTRNGGGSGEKCSKSCKIARRSFISPLYVHELLSSLLSPGAVERIKDPLAVAHHTWAQIRRLLFPEHTQHLPYDTRNTWPPVFTGISSASSVHPPHPPSRSQLPPPLTIDFSISRLQLWTELFCRWLPEVDLLCSWPKPQRSKSIRRLKCPQNTNLLFWNVVYDMHNMLHEYLVFSDLRTDTFNGRNDVLVN